MLSGFIRQPLTIALAIPTAFKLASRTFRPSIASLTTNVNKEDRVPEPTTALPPPPQKRPARRRGINKSVGGDGTQQQQSMPTLADFIHRAKVRQQYRNFIRLAHFVDGTGDGSASTRATGECRAALEEVRLSFKMGMKKAIDSLSRKMAFAEGERKLRELEAMVGYSPKKQSTSMSHESYDDDSWINIKDEEDPRGRVGLQWPWERDDKSK